MPFKVCQLTIILYVLLCSQTEGLIFDLEPNSKKCLKNEVFPKALVKGNYNIKTLSKQKIDITIHDSKGNILFQQTETLNGRNIKHKHFP